MGQELPCSASPLCPITGGAAQRKGSVEEGSWVCVNNQSAIIKKMAACRSEKHYFPNLFSCKNIKKIFNTPYKFNQICFHSPENFC